jgi:hypothetical protein
MRKLVLAAALLAASVPAAAYAEDAKFSTATTPISELVANPEAKAVLEKRMPQIMQYAGQLGTSTLKQLQGMAQGAISDQMLADIDADLAMIK